MPWIVHATAPKQEAGKVRPLWPFKEGFFPREVYYKKDAIELAHQARSYGIAALQSVGAQTHIKAKCQLERLCKVSVHRQRKSVSIDRASMQEQLSIAVVQIHHNSF